MYDADAIEAINFEQLATLTDRMLLRGRAAKQWPAIPSLVDGASGTPRTARGSQPRIDVRTIRARAEQARLDQARLEHARAEQARAEQALETTYIVRHRRPALAARVATKLARRPAVVAPVAPAPVAAVASVAAKRANDWSPAERTTYVREKPATRAEVVTVTVVIPALVGIATGLAALLVF